MATEKEVIVLLEGEALPLLKFTCSEDTELPDRITIQMQCVVAERNEKGAMYVMKEARLHERTD